MPRHLQGEGDKLTINNQMVKLPVGKLTAAYILSVQAASRTCVKQVPKGASKTVAEQGSTCTAEAYKATNVAEVRDIYRTLVGCPTKAQAMYNITNGEFLYR